MTEIKNCPQCGGTLQAEVVGKYHDKFMICSYCQYKIDVPDEFEVKRSEESRSPDGSRHKVEVSYRRRDLTPGENDLDEDMPDYVKRLIDKEASPEGEKIIRKKLRTDDAHFTEVVRERQIVRHEIVDRLEEAFDEDSGIAELREYASRVAADSGKDGVEHVVTKTETREESPSVIFIQDQGKIKTEAFIEVCKFGAVLLGITGFIIFVFWLLAP